MEQEIWERINSLIKEKNLTQSSLSAICGFNQRRIQNLSAANRLPDAVEIVAIAKALETTAEYLVTGQYSAIQYTDVYKQKYDKLVSDIKALIP